MSPPDHLPERGAAPGPGTPEAEFDHPRSATDAALAMFKRMLHLKQVPSRTAVNHAIEAAAPHLAPAKERLPAEPSNEAVRQACVAYFGKGTLSPIHMDRWRQVLETAYQVDSSPSPDREASEAVALLREITPWLLGTPGLQRFDGWAARSQDFLKRYARQGAAEDPETRPPWMGNPWFAVLDDTSADSPSPDPAPIQLSDEELQALLAWRQPTEDYEAYTSAKEKLVAELYRRAGTPDV